MSNYFDHLLGYVSIACAYLLLTVLRLYCIDCVLNKHYHDENKFTSTQSGQNRFKTGFSLNKLGIQRVQACTR